MRITDKGFFNAPVLDLAHDLLGKIIVRRMSDGSVKRFRITEVEAYGGMEDSASHASRGKTQRNAPMFESGGILYVYLCYGIFNLLNFVSGAEDSPEGVMIRGVSPISEQGQVGINIEGPGRSSRAMEITRELNREDLLSSERFWLEDDGTRPDPEDIEHLKRVGIGYATQEDQDRLWRLRVNLVE